MELLVTGMHRSGTSAMSKLLAVGCQKYFLDDPEWAIENPRRYKKTKIVNMLSTFDIVKCPRFGAFLCDFMSIYNNTKVLFMIRDPRDIVASIYEKIALNRPTRMLAFPELDAPQKQLDSFVTAYSHYLQELQRASEMNPNNIFIISYEEFYYRRLSFVSLVANKMKWKINKENIIELCNCQLGPLGHKPSNSPSTIKGPGRYLDELQSETLSSITKAIDLWQYSLSKAVIIHAKLSI